MSPDSFPTFRAAHPECVLLVLSDIRSGTVLAADCALDHPQEYLDAIGQSASQILGLAPTAAGPALFQTPTGLRVYLAIPNLRDTVLTCIAHPGIDPAALVTAVSTFADTIGIPEVAA